MKKILLLIFLFICISTLFISCVSNSSEKKETFDDLEINSEENENNKEVDIRIQQGIKINGDIPGYRIIVTNWGSRESLSLDLVDSLGKTINLINDKQNVKSDDNGMITIDIPYEYGDVTPGLCMLLLSGNPGVHLVKIEYPDSNERAPFELVMAVDDEQYFSADMDKTLYVINDKIVQIFPGEKLYIEADILNEELVNLKRVKSITNPDKTITLEFKQVSEGKQHKYMMLFIENPFEKRLRYSANICLLKYGKWVATDVYDVEARKSNYEMWPDLITSIALDSFKLIE